MINFWEQINAALLRSHDSAARLSDFIGIVRDKADLQPGEAVQAMNILVSGTADPVEQKNFLTALQEKGVTIDELAAFAITLRRLAKRVDIDREDLKTRQAILVDTCGTGGGTIETFNVSTTTMFILAAAGCVIAKHGNRAITSKCGSADVLEKLGVVINLSPENVGRCLTELGMGFLFAPHFHQAFKHVQQVRKEMGTPTVFNFLGPLCNPAFYPEDRYRTGQLLGVRSPDMMDNMIKVLQRLKLERGYVVHGLNQSGDRGMDEVSTLGKTMITELTADRGIICHEISPADFNITIPAATELAGGSAEQNAAIVTAILQGRERSPRTDLVVLNAALGLCAGGKATSIAAGISQARECIHDGSAYRKLRELIAFTQSLV